jgi:hypothetical protein
MGDYPMRFSLRDLIWLTTLCAVSLGWYADRNSEWKRLCSAAYEKLCCYELSKRVAAVGGWENVHYVELVYSRWYGVEWKIGPVDKQPVDHHRVTGPASTKAGVLEDYNDPTLKWPMPTMLR